MADTIPLSPDGIVEFPLAGRLDAYSSTEIEANLLAKITPETKLLLLDFRQLEFISSAGIRVLIVAKKKMQNVQGRMTVYGCNEYITNLFHISGLTKSLELYGTREDAIKGSA